MIFIEQTVVLVLLIILSYIDFKERVVPHWGVLALLFYSIFLFWGDLAEHSLMGLMVFVALAIGYFLFKDAIGGGDVKILSALAFYMGYDFYFLLSVLLPVMILGLIIGGLKEKKLYFSVPLVPFITVSFSIFLIFF